MVLFEDARAITETTDDAANALLRSLTEQILIRASRFSAGRNRELLDRRISAAKEYIFLHIHDSMTVDEVAEHVGMSRSNLSRLFRMQTGLGLIDWRSERRMGRACYLLAMSERRICAIAEDVSYADPLYFSRTFAKMVGCRPRQYRHRRRAKFAGAPSRA